MKKQILNWLTWLVALGCLMAWLAGAQERRAAVIYPASNFDATTAAMTATAPAMAPAATPAAKCHYRRDGSYALPDPACTPGLTNPTLTKEVLCAKSFRTGPYRKVEESEKKAACREYGITSGCPGPGYELDHLISLEIGGGNGLSNLWPQLIGQARLKDHWTEDKLPKLVCSGKLTLKEAQTCIRGDWVACMARVKKLEGGK